MLCLAFSTCLMIGCGAGKVTTAAPGTYTLAVRLTSGSIALQSVNVTLVVQ